METNNLKTESGKFDTDGQSFDTSCNCGNIKTVIADKIQKIAAAVGVKAVNQDAQSGMAQYGKKASELLNESAEYIRQFDCHEADAKVREHIGQNPLRSLLIAGGAGLLVGAIFRRR